MCTDKTLSVLRYNKRILIYVVFVLFLKWLAYGSILSEKLPYFTKSARISKLLIHLVPVNWQISLQNYFGYLRKNSNKRIFLDCHLSFRQEIFHGGFDRPVLGRETVWKYVRKSLCKRCLTDTVLFQKKYCILFILIT